ncbi:MAG: UDP-2,3-diacylglucosamine diphosphatase [Candidatus Cloacimonetes bacterium]|nr:UDP-2,3-diacylglucosamine diphosphatase [Candidatus Cloacimonadota bacterium]
MKIIVISDLHLKYNDSPGESEKLARFNKFLAEIKQDTDLLILNGDIFDLWFSWNKVIIKQYFPVLRKFAELIERGCRIVFIAGNHDFWFNDFLTEYLKIEIYPDHWCEEIDGKKIFAAHGDVYTYNDGRYRFFRKIVRNKLIKAIFSQLHPDLALTLASGLSRSSRRKPIPDKLQKMREKGLLENADQLLKKHDIVIFSHSHLPRIVIRENGVYVNSGDWINHFSYISIINGQVSLKKYRDKE